MVRDDQPDAREGQAGRRGDAEGLDAAMRECRQKALSFSERGHSVAQTLPYGPLRLDRAVRRAYALIRPRR